MVTVQFENEKHLVPLRALNRRSETKTLVAKVELGVVGPKEHITEDPEGAEGRRNVKSNEAADANGLRANGLLWMPG